MRFLLVVGLITFGLISCSGQDTGAPGISSFSANTSSLSSGKYYCGSSWAGAMCADKQECPSATNAECSFGETCYPLPGLNWCGSDYADALNKTKACPSGTDADCDSGTTCHKLPGNRWCGIGRKNACSNRQRGIGKQCPDGKDSSCGGTYKVFGKTVTDKCHTLPVAGCSDTKDCDATAKEKCWNVCGLDWLNASALLWTGEQKYCCNDSDCDLGLKCIKGPFKDLSK